MHTGAGTRVCARIRPSAGSIAGALAWLAWITFLSYQARSVVFWMLGVAMEGGMLAFSSNRMASWKDGLLAIVREAAAADALAAEHVGAERP
jgi:hypothetical protein